MSLSQLLEDWQVAKDAEKAANSERIGIEAQIAMFLKVPDYLDGTIKEETDTHKLTITGRINKKIDADLLQEIAAENGTSDYLGTLFNWTPKLDAKAWKNANESITKPLLSAITSSAGKPSFKVEKK